MFMRHCTVQCAALLLAGAALNAKTAAQTYDHLFIANENVPYAVREYDAASGGLLNILDNPSWTSSGAGRTITFDGAGHLWVADVNSSALYEFDVNRSLLNTYPVAAPHGINDVEYSPVTGLIYMITRTGPSSTGQNIVEVDPATGIQTVQVSWSCVWDPSRISIAPNGDIYVTRSEGAPFAARVYDPVTYAFSDIPLPGHDTALNCGGNPPCYSDPEDCLRFRNIAFVGGSFYISSGNGSTGTEGWIDEYDLATGTWIATRYHNPIEQVGLIEEATGGSIWAGVGPDVCEIDLATGTVIRCLDLYGLTPGSADLALQPMGDCNDNGITDAIDIADGTSTDDNHNGIPDECEKSCCLGDLNCDGVVNVVDLLALLGAWGPCLP